MPIDVAVLASAVVANFLAPYAKMGGDAIAQAVANKVGQAAAEHTTGTAAKVWNRVKAAFGSKPEDEAVLAQLETRPERAAPLVEDILKEKLEKDEKLARDLEKLVSAPSPDGAGDSLQIMAGTVGIAYAQGATIHGVVAGVYQGPPGQPESAPRQNPGQNASPLERTERRTPNDAHDEFDD